MGSEHIPLMFVLLLVYVVSVLGADCKKNNNSN